MIKKYCDRCGKEIDKKYWRFCYYKFESYGEDIILDICEGCMSEFTKWFGADILAKLEAGDDE